MQNAFRPTCSSDVQTCHDVVSVKTYEIENYFRKIELNLFLLGRGCINLKHFSINITPLPSDFTSIISVSM